MCNLHDSNYCTGCDPCTHGYSFVVPEQVKDEYADSILNEQDEDYEGYDIGLGHTQMTDAEKAEIEDEDDLPW